MCIFRIYFAAAHLYYLLHLNWKTPSSKTNLRFELGGYSNKRNAYFRRKMIKKKHLLKKVHSFSFIRLSFMKKIWIVKNRNVFTANQEAETLKLYLNKIHYWYKFPNGANWLYSSLLALMVLLLSWYCGKI